MHVLKWICCENKSQNDQSIFISFTYELIDIQLPADVAWGGVGGGGGGYAT